MCLGFNHYSGFLHHFVLAKLATTSIRVKIFLNLLVYVSEVNEFTFWYWLIIKMTYIVRIVPRPLIYHRTLYITCSLGKTPLWCSSNINDFVLRRKPIMNRVLIGSYRSPNDAFISSRRIWLVQPFDSIIQPAKNFLEMDLGGGGGGGGEILFLEDTVRYHTKPMLRVGIYFLNN